MIGGLAYVANPIFGPKAILSNDLGLSYLHVGMGLILIVMSFTGEGRSAYTLFLSAFVLGMFALAGFLGLNSYSGMANLFDILYPRTPDIYFHAGLAVVLGLCGKCNTSRNQLFYE
jgi:hypothetical protein